MTRFHPSSPAPDSPFFVGLTMGGTLASPVWQAIVSRGRVLERHRATDDANMFYWEPDNLMDGTIPRRFTVGSGDAIYVQVDETIPNTEITAVTLITGASNLQSEETSSTNTRFRYKLAEFTYDADGFMIAVPLLVGGHIYHWPEGKGLDLIVKNLNYECGFISAGSPDVTHYWRKGGYVGTVDPGTGADETQEVTNINVI